MTPEPTDEQRAAHEAERQQAAAEQQRMRAALLALLERSAQRRGA